MTFHCWSTLSLLRMEKRREAIPKTSAARRSRVAGTQREIRSRCDPSSCLTCCGELTRGALSWIEAPTAIVYPETQTRALSQRTDCWSKALR
jgi:hypothetical protein